MSSLPHSLLIYLCLTLDFWPSIYTTTGFPTCEFPVSMPRKGAQLLTKMSLWTRSHCDLSSGFQTRFLSNSPTGNTITKGQRLACWCHLCWRVTQTCRMATLIPPSLVLKALLSMLMDRHNIASHANLAMAWAPLPRNGPFCDTDCSKRVAYGKRLKANWDKHREYWPRRHTIVTSVRSHLPQGGPPLFCDEFPELGRWGRRYLTLSGRWGWANEAWMGNSQGQNQANRKVLSEQPTQTRGSSHEHSDACYAQGKSWDAYLILQNCCKFNGFTQKSIDKLPYI